MEVAFDAAVISRLSSELSVLSAQATNAPLHDLTRELGQNMPDGLLARMYRLAAQSRVRKHLRPHLGFSSERADCGFCPPVLLWQVAKLMIALLWDKRVRPDTSSLVQTAAPGLQISGRPPSGAMKPNPLSLHLVTKPEVRQRRRKDCLKASGPLWLRG